MFPHSMGNQRPAPTFESRLYETARRVSGVLVWYEMTHEEEPVPENRRSEAQVAFIAAVVVLLALPLLAAIGLAALALEARGGITSGAGLALFVLWVVLVVVAVLVFAVRFVRRSAQH
jgi:hypothetical protein